MKTRVKICGITNAADAEAAIRAGADALGFNFFPGSKRYLDLERERAWLENIPPQVLRVAVVVNVDREKALRFLAEPFIDAIQLHGDETPKFVTDLCESQPKRVIKALRIRNAESLADLKRFDFVTVLVDAWSDAGFGGHGKTFDWKLLREVTDRERLILSGGLTPENVAEALRVTGVRFVDVASGVESSPRQKSEEKMVRFVEAASLGVA
ncbi:MAG TPA: phosphoribosylanthranilate isomerase [Chthoniobacterales bacterium]